MKKIKTPDKISKQMDLRELRGQPIPSSSKMRSKMDKARDPKNSTRRPVSRDEYYESDMVDVDTEMWEIVDKIQSLLKSDQSIATVDIMDDQPPAIQINTKNGAVIGLTFEAY